MQLKKCGPSNFKTASSVVWKLTNRGSFDCRAKQIENLQDNQKVIYTVQVPRRQHQKPKPTQVTKEKK